MERRGFLQSILALGVAPWVVTKSGVLMPVRKIVTEFEELTLYEQTILIEQLHTPYRGGKSWFMAQEVLRRARNGEKVLVVGGARTRSLIEELAKPLEVPDTIIYNTLKG
ncbi:MAG: hypothetical protein U1A72_00785 [Sulfuritalea sp.]|nr:hypothetical protein [Sulfuritalea sp.]